MHLTLKFLGEVDDGRVPAIKQKLELVCSRHAAHDLKVRGCGAFPPKGKPNVVWLGLSGALDSLAGLAADISQDMADLGFEEEKRAFRPHLTLGRARRPRGGKKPPAGAGQGLIELKRAIAGLRGYKGPDFSADCVILMMSILTPKGPIYEPLRTITLQ